MEMMKICHIPLDRDFDFLGEHAISAIADDLDVLGDAEVVISRLLRVKNSVLDPGIFVPVL